MLAILPALAGLPEADRNEEKENRCRYAGKIDRGLCVTVCRRIKWKQNTL